MEKRNYTIAELEIKLKEHPLFNKLSGNFILMMNSIDLQNKLPSFNCDQEELSLFLDQIMEATVALSRIPASEAPKEWAPLPGISKKAILERYLEHPSLYLELLRDDPNIVIIKKISDMGTSIIWKIPDGRIGGGGHTII